MRHFFAAIFVTIWASGLFAQPRDDVQATIQSQIDAFLANDVAQAFTFASPGIQGLFKTPQRFGEMVQRGYPMVWRPSGITYLEQQNRAGQVWQNVLITDQQGRGHLLRYRLSQEKDGWKISGVEHLRDHAPNV